MLHRGFRIRVVVEQVLRDDPTGDRPGNEPQRVIVHAEQQFHVQDVDFSEALAHPVAAIADIQAYDVAVKMGEDVDTDERVRREARAAELQGAAEALRGKGGA